MWRGVDATRLRAARGRAVAAGRARLLGLLGWEPMGWQGAVVRHVLRGQYVGGRAAVAGGARVECGVGDRCGVPTGGSGACCDAVIGVRASIAGAVPPVVVRAVSVRSQLEGLELLRSTVWLGLHPGCPKPT